MEERVSVCTVNVGTLIGRRREVVEMLARRRVDICCLQEVRYKNKGTTSFGSNEEKYKLWYSGNSEGSSGVGILVKHCLAERVLEVERVNERLMKIRILLGKSIYSIYSAYAPQSGLPTQEKEAFWERFEEEVARVPSVEGVIIGGDLNGHIGANREGFTEIMGPYGYGNKNREGETILEFCKNQNLRILNSFFKKDKNKTVTYVSGGAETQLDLILLRPRTDIKPVDCRAIPGECCVTQHRPVRADFRVSHMKRRKVGGRRKLKAWKLKDEQVRREFTSKLEEKFREIGPSWRETQTAILEACKDTCGETSGRRGRERETWWWCEEVQRAVSEKKAAYVEWQRSGTAEDEATYRARNKDAKRAVAIAKQSALDTLSENLQTTEGRRKMFAIAKQLKKDKKDIIGGYFVKGANGEIETTESDIRDRWKNYFDGLLNVENPSVLDDVECVEGPLQDVTCGEVVAALKAMKPNKAPGPSGLSCDILKSAGGTVTEQLTRIFQHIMSTEVAPAEWKESITIPIFKGKGDPLQCDKYRGLRLLEHSMKVWEKILDSRLKLVVKISNNQFGFTSGRSTTDAIHILRQVQHMYIEKKKKLYHIFIDLEKAFDRVPRWTLRWAMRRQLVPEKLVRLVMALYDDSRSCVAAAGGLSNAFNVSVGVHQGSALSPLLFNLVMEEATKECHRGVPWDLLYADDMIITGESKEEVEEQFHHWKAALERRGLKINIGKTKILVSGKEGLTPLPSGQYPCAVCARGVGANSVLCTRCGKWVHKRCSGLRNVTHAAQNYACPTCVQPSVGAEAESEQIVLGPDSENVIEEVQTFTYLGDIVDRDGGVERAVRGRLAVAWCKWREIAGLLCNKRLPIHSRSRVYDACIRSVMLYGAETWPLTQRLERSIISCDRRMLRYMTGVRLQDHVPSLEVAGRCELHQISDVLRKRRLGWYGHVKRRGEGEALATIRDWTVEGRRPRGRPRKTWLDNVREDMRLLGITEEMALDREMWRSAIARPTPHVGNNGR